MISWYLQPKIFQQTRVILLITKKLRSIPTHMILSGSYDGKVFPLYLSWNYFLKQFGNSTETYNNADKRRVLFLFIKLRKKCPKMKQEEKKNLEVLHLSICPPSESLLKKATTATHWILKSHVNIIICWWGSDNGSSNWSIHISYLVAYSRKTNLASYFKVCLSLAMSSSCHPKKRNVITS